MLTFFGSKHVAINSTTKAVSMVFISLIIRKYNRMSNFKILGFNCVVFRSWCNVSVYTFRVKLATAIHAETLEVSSYGAVRPERSKLHIK